MRRRLMGSRAQFYCAGKLQRGLVVNLSASGLCLFSGDPLRRGQAIKAFVPLPHGHGKRLSLFHGVVVWSAGRCCGVRLVRAETSDASPGQWGMAPKRR